MLALARSTTEFLLIVLAAWLAIGLTLAVVMGRRGHGAFQWFLVGAVLGPLALPLAWTSVRDEGRASARPMSASRQARQDEERAVALLEEAASSFEGHAPGRVLLSGQPADALMKHAADEGYDLLAVGRRGRGASKALLGSTADRVSRGAIPVLIV